MYRIEPLKGPENFVTWKVKMTDILTALDLWEYASGTKAEPNDAPEKEAWRKEHRAALTAIRLRVADNVMVYIASAEKSSEAWQTLADVSQPKVAIAIVLARRKFYRAECLDGSNIEEHIRTLRGYQEELHMLGQKVENNDFVMTLLTSLPESWNAFISSIGIKDKMSAADIIARVL